MEPDLLIPDWPAPPNVRACVTTRRGGVSVAPYDGFNLGDHVGDDPAAIAENRRRLRARLPAEPYWLQQVHGVRCVEAGTKGDGELGEIVTADASFTRAPGVVCAVLTADCLPVLLCDTAGSVVAVAHAGWRGLLAGVLESTVAAMGVRGGQLLAWLGPAIGAANFEVGAEVREAFVAHDAAAAAAFIPRGQHKWLGDLHELARQRLAALQIRRVASADFCTVRDQTRFYSFRRDGVTGRMATLIWRV